jgi:hypothetical protein
MSGIFGKSETAKARRNAQSIVSTFNSARAAGNTASYANAAAAITAVTSTAGLAGAGAFAGSQFSAPMSSTESTAASTGIGLSGTTGGSVMTLTAQ